MPTPTSILIVEDEAIVAADLAGKVVQLGFDVAGVANTGEEAVQLAHAKRPSLVLMDIRLAGAMNGVTAAALIHRQCDLPVLFLTAHSDWSTIEGAREVEAFGYLLKPFDERNLRIQIEMALYKHAAEKRLREKEARLAGLVSSAMDAIISLDDAQHVVLFNPAAERMFGVPQAEVIGQPLDRLVPDYMQRARAAHIRERAQGGATGGRTGTLGELTGRKADGAEFPLEGTLSHVQTAEGPLFTMILRDISARKQAEEILRSSRVAAINLMEDAIESRQALRDAMQRLDAHMANCPLAIVEFNSDMRVSRWSGDAERIFGWTAEEAFGKTIAELNWVHEADVEDVTRNAAEMLAGRLPRNVQTNRNFRKDGTLIRCEWYNSAIYDAAGKLESVFSQVLEITERERALEALRESEARFREMADSAPVLIWLAGPDKCYTWVNQPWLKFTGRSMEQELGSGWTEGLHPEDRERCLHIYASAFDSRQEFKMDYRLRRQDGAWRWIFDHGRPLWRGADFAGFIGSCVDVTTRKEAEAAHRRMNAELETRVAERTRALREANAALRQNEEKFRAWADQSPNLIFVYYGNRMVYANRMSEALLGYSPEEMCAADFFLGNLLVPKSSASLQGLLRYLISGVGEDGMPTEITLRHKRGSRVDAILAIRPIDYEEGRARLCILTDITERKRAERTRQAQQRRMRQLAGMLATAQDDEQRRIGEGLHDDVAQVIAASSVKLALVRTEADPNFRDRLYDQIDQLLREADEKIHSLSFELGASTLHQSGLGNAVRELCDRMAARYGVNFAVTIEGKAHPLPRGSATVLFKAARELLFNVVKHAAVREASIALIWRADETHIEVVDHGKGIRGLDANRLTNSRKGLGLFAVRERLRDFGGELLIQSTRGGETRVTVRVPRERVTK